MVLLMVTMAYKTANRAIDDEISATKKMKEQYQTELTKVQEEINITEKNISEKSALISQAQAQQQAPNPEDIQVVQQGGAKLEELKPQEAQLTGKINGMNNKLKSLENSKPKYAPMLISSLLISYIVGFIVSFIAQPIFKKMTFKKYGIPA